MVFLVMLDRYVYARCRMGVRIRCMLLHGDDLFPKNVLWENHFDAGMCASLFFSLILANFSFSIFFCFNIFNVPSRVFILFCLFIIAFNSF